MKQIESRKLVCNAGMVASWCLKLVGMEIGKWTEYVIGMEDPVILQNTGVPPGGGALGDDGCGYLFCVLKREREEGGSE